jgi:hypothetical protein
MEGVKDVTHETQHGYMTYTRRPSDFCPKVSKCLNEYGGLDGPRKVCSKPSALMNYASKKVTHIWRHPAMRAPFNGWEAPC